MQSIDCFDMHVSVGEIINGQGSSLFAALRQGATMLCFKKTMEASLIAKL
jgi:hypothetical protein